MKSFIAALAAAYLLAMGQASAFDSYQGGQAWGTGTSAGAYRGGAHASLAQNGIRIKKGDNITSSLIETNGVKNIFNITGNNNDVDDVKLNGETTDSEVSTDGYIAGGNGGDFNPFEKNAKK